MLKPAMGRISLLFILKLPVVGVKIVSPIVKLVGISTPTTLFPKIKIPCSSKSTWKSWVFTEPKVALSI